MEGMSYILVGGICVWSFVRRIASGKGLGMLLQESLTFREWSSEGLWCKCRLLHCCLLVFAAEFLWKKQCL